MTQKRAPRATKWLVPTTIGVAVLAATVLSGCGAKPIVELPDAGDPGDAGEQPCGPSCGVLHDTDGGIYRTEDGGVQCLC